ncbi:MAG: hypothetical protein IJ748_02125 [Bacteroidales bacterium]|nr:hypothetical protein [Bacteroidales bacterium]
MTNAELKKELSKSLRLKDIKFLSKNAEKEDVFSLMFSRDKRCSDNAAWLMTYLPKTENKFLEQKRNILIDAVLTTDNKTRLRLLLNLLERLDYKSEDLRTDFVDFCLKNSVSLLQSAGVQVLCLKLAYKQCVLYDELLSELYSTLSFIHSTELSPGVKNQFQKILSQIESKR